MTISNKEIIGLWNTVACDYIDTYGKAKIKDELIYLKNGTFYYNSPLISGKFKPPLVASKESVLSILSQWEIGVLNQIAQGTSSQMIVVFIQISTNTVNTHRRKIIKKLHAKNINEVISKGILDNTITL